MTIAVPAILLQWGVFKYFYPFASFFFTDSFAYLHAAAFNLDAYIWPVGYSKFLRVFNSFFHSDAGLVCFQYLFLQACGLYFLFTLLYLFRPSKSVTIILFIIQVVNPLFLYLGNAVSSDALFIGCSLLWTAQLMQLIDTPSRQRIFVQAMLLALLFALRYTAIYYPLIAAIAILFSAHTRKEKIIAIALPVLLMLGFMYYTALATEEMTGIRKFSPFSGWQLANNALYMYEHARSPGDVSGARMTQSISAGRDGGSSSIPSRFEALDGHIRRFFDSVKTERTLFDIMYPGIFYLWSPQSPLATYRDLQNKKDSAAWYKNWVMISSLYSDYGSWLIRQHPLAYAEYFCLPNLQRYALPPLEFMGKYNSGMDTVDKMTAAWFQYKDQRVKAFSPTIQAAVLAPYPFLNMLLNLFFLGMFFLFFTRKKVRGGGGPQKAGSADVAKNAGVADAPKKAREPDAIFFRQMVVGGGLCFVHCCFSILACPVVLRYQVFPMMLGGACSILLAEHLLRGEWMKQTKIIVEVCSFSLVFLFVYTATAKLFQFQLFRYRLDTYPWIRHVGGLIAWGVPLLELTIAVLLISERRKLIGFYAAFGLMAIFTIYLVLMLSTEQHLPCSCGGAIEGLTWRQHIVFNLFFLVLAGLGIKIVHSLRFSSPLKL